MQTRSLMPETSLNCWVSTMICTLRTHEHVLQVALGCISLCSHYLFRDCFLIECACSCSSPFKIDSKHTLPPKMCEREHRLSQLLRCSLGAVFLTNCHCHNMNCKGMVRNHRPHNLRHVHSSNYFG